jgi:signal transduction histidine kinase
MPLKVHAPLIYQTRGGMATTDTLKELNEYGQALSLDMINKLNGMGRIEAQKVIEKFIYSCSHDLRAPVSSIQGLVRIAEYYPHHEETHKCLEMIEACTQKMDKLIRSLEEYMINAQHELNMEEVNGVELLEQVINNYEEELTTKGITVTKEINMATPWITDRYSTYQIIKHLFSNAVVFSDDEKPDKNIFIRLNSTKDDASIEVIDNGLGIPRTDQQKIFDVFFRGSSQSQGLGMGLFLVDHLIQKIKANVTFNSIEKKGSSFKVFMPN